MNTLQGIGDDIGDAFTNNYMKANVSEPSLSPLELPTTKTTCR